MTNDAVSIARKLASELAEYSASSSRKNSGDSSPPPPEDSPLSPDDGLLVAYDSRISDQDLRIATRSRFISKHYADAVEAGVKTLNECIRTRTNRKEDGDSLITVVFSPSNPLLRINRGRTKSDESEQKGHMQMCQGVISAWRNPRAHALIDDSPKRALMMLETINDLIEVTKAATRTRRRSK